MKKLFLLRENHSLLPSQLGVHLEAEGFCVDHPTASAEQWIHEIQQVQPDLILLEVHPGKTEARYAFCQALREIPQTENTPVLLLGADDGNGKGQPHVQYLLEGIEAGANDYLQAPSELPELLQKINLASRLKQAMDTVQALSDQLNSVNEELYERNVHVEKDLYVARQLQQSLLPPALDMAVDENDEFGPMYTKLHYQDEKLRITGIYFPCDALGGDLYDILKLPDNTLGVTISDVSGHGVPAGFITAIFKTSVLRMAHQYRDPSEVMFHLNNELHDIITTGDYITGIYLTLNLDTLALETSGAGHPYPVYYEARTGEIHRIKKNGTPWVWVPNMDFPKERIQLAPGDKLYLFTDGVSEIKNLADEMFGEDRLEALIRQGIEMKVPYLTDFIISALSDFTEGAPLGDDISMVLIEADTFAP